MEACSLEKAPPKARPLYQNKYYQVVVFPNQLAARYSGCQRTWIVYENSREKSMPMTDAFFVAGKPVRHVTYSGVEIARDCRYVRGSLDVASSLRPASCPPATMLLDAAKEGASTLPYIEK